MKERRQGKAGIWSNLGIVVWGVYGFLSSRGEWLEAGLAGFAIVALILTMQFRRNAVKVMDCTSLSYFTGEVILELAGQRSIISNYRLVIVWGVFAAVAWMTLIMRFPFTVQYLRENTPSKAWDQPLFLRMNILMTEVWAMIFTLGAILGAASFRFGHTLILGLIIPGAAMIFGYAFTISYPRRFADQLKNDHETTARGLPSIGRPL